MYLFLKRCFLFLFITFLIIYAFVSYHKVERANYRQTYLHGIIDKHQLLDTTSSPRIIIVGGSNNAFGIDSEMIENEFNLPVVNLSINGGLGLYYMLGEVVSETRKGDIVLLSIEYFAKDNRNFLVNKLRSFPELLQYSSHYNIIDKVDLKISAAFKNVQAGILEYIYTYLPDRNVPEKPKPPKVPIYYRKAFNSNGDVISHLDLEGHLEKSDRQYYPYKYWEQIDDLNKFIRTTRKRGAEVFYLFPTYAKSFYIQDAESLKLLELDIKTNLNVVVLNELESFVYPDSLFFDSNFHLTGKGRHQRTLDLIEILSNNEDFRLQIAQSN